jgi:ribonuclease BN (tRNA processing enzyme)
MKQLTNRTIQMKIIILVANCEYRDEYDDYTINSDNDKDNIDMSSYLGDDYYLENIDELSQESDPIIHESIVEDNKGDNEGHDHNSKLE